MRKFLIYLMAVCCFIPILISNTAGGDALVVGAAARGELGGAWDGRDL